ncbi:MAG: hypothetical protein ABR498_02370 [Candidatus Dormibacteria bacterium]
MNRIFSAIGVNCRRYRWPIVLFWVIVTVVCVRTLPGLSDVSRTAQSTFLPASTPSVQAQLLAQPFEDSHNATATIVAASQSGPMSAKQTQAVVDVNYNGALNNLKKKLDSDAV